MIVETVGKRLRNYRMRSELSQERLAEAAGFHPTYIGQVERGEKNLTLESLEKICIALKLPMAALFEGLMPKEGGVGIPMQCYELVDSMDETTQRRMLRVLLEMCEIKQSK